MILAPFELHRPDTLAEALALAAVHAGDFDWIAGGTDLLQNYKNRLNARGHVISVERIEELGGVGESRLGAMTRLTRLAEDPSVRERWPGLAEAAGSVASPLVRNSGTLGGNLLVENRCYWFNQTPFWRSTKGSCLKAESDECRVIPQKEVCYAAYSGDLAPVLMTLGASLDLASAAGRRTIALADFFRGDGIERNVKRPEEIVVAVILPPEAATLRSGYEKLRHRDTLDYPEVGVAAALGVDAEGRLEVLRCAHTAVDTVPRLVDYSGEIAGRPLSEIDESIAARVAADMEENAQPSRNTSMPVGYRKKMVRVFLEKLLRRLAAERTVSTE